MPRKKCERIFVPFEHVQGRAEHDHAVPGEGSRAAQRLTFDVQPVVAQRCCHRFGDLLR